MIGFISSRESWCKCKNKRLNESMAKEMCGFLLLLLHVIKDVKLLEKIRFATVCNHRNNYFQVIPREKIIIFIYVHLSNFF